MKAHPVAFVAMFLVSANIASAQSGWEARVSATPNPLPAGKCATLVVEPVDDHGYRRTTLSNGAQLDLRKYTYVVGDAAHFVVRNDPAMWGSVCADSSTPSTSTIATVTLPDGLKGTVQIYVIAKGAPPARAVVYRKQAPLRLPSSPEYAPGFVAAKASGGAAASGVSGADPTSDPNAVSATPPADPASDPNAVGAAASADPTTDPAAVGAGANSGVPVTSAGAASHPAAPHATPRATSGTVETLLHTQASVATPQLSLVGTYHVLSVIETTAALSLTGTYHALSVAATTATLSLTGTYGSHPLPQTTPHGVTPKPIPPGAHSP